MPEPLVTRALALLHAIERGEVTVTKDVLMLCGPSAFYATSTGDELEVEVTRKGEWNGLWSVQFDGDGARLLAFDYEELLAYRPPREVIERVYGLRGDA